MVTRVSSPVNSSSCLERRTDFSAYRDSVDFSAPCFEMTPSAVATQPPHGSGMTNILNARIAEIRDQGPDKVNVRLMIGPSQALLSRITRRSRGHLGLIGGMYVCAQVKSVALM